MQKRPSHVKICTGASWRIVRGISRKAAMISLKPAAKPCFSRRILSNASMSSGGYSLVVNTVQSTASKNATAPIWKANFIVNGMPLAVLPEMPKRRNASGSQPANVAPNPMKNDCITNPVVRWSAFSLSATKARNGSMLTLILASKIQSSPAAIHRLEDVGMKKRATLARIAPTRK